MEDVVERVAIVLGILIGGALLVWGFGCLVTAEDYDEWNQLNNNCFVHDTKVNNAWLTKGHNGPEIRTIYCKTELEAVTK